MSPRPQPTGRATRPPRLCRTPTDAFHAGQADGAHDRPLDAEERAKILGLLRPYRDQLVNTAAVA